jgi:pyrroloquinoline quinone biosynthesis protein B
VTLQTERYLPPSPESPIRASPVAGIFLTNADLDHTLGLFQLREGERLSITAPDGVRAALCDGLRLEEVLGAYGGVAWTEAVAAWTPVAEGLEVRAVPFPRAEPPRYAPATGGAHGVGYLFRSGPGAPTLGVFPDVAECRRVYIDGTFWSDDEMAHLGISSRSAQEMGHLPVGGKRGSLDLLSRQGVRAVYLHLNNTNPLLLPDSAERLAVAAGGLRVAEDGERFSL